MVTRIIDRSIVITRYKGIDFKYHKTLALNAAMTLAKNVALSDSINYKDYWIPLDPSKIVMMKLDTKNDLVEYNPTFQNFDQESVRRFISRGITKFHARRAYWRRHKETIVCVAGAFVNAKYSGLTQDELSNLFMAMESYNTIIKTDVTGGKYAIGSTFMRFSELITN